MCLFEKATYFYFFTRNNLNIQQLRYTKIGNVPPATEVDKHVYFWHSDFQWLQRKRKAKEKIDCVANDMLEKGVDDALTANR